MKGKRKVEEPQGNAFNHSVLIKAALHKAQAALQSGVSNHTVEESKGTQRAREGNTGHKEIILTDEDIKDVELLGCVLTKENLAALLGVSTKTLFNICKRDDRVDTAVTRGRAALEFMAASELFTHAFVNKNLAALLFLLKTKFHWREKGDHDVNASIEQQPTKIEIILKPNDHIRIEEPTPIIEPDKPIIDDVIIEDINDDSCIETYKNPSYNY